MLRVARPDGKKFDLKQWLRASYRIGLGGTVSARAAWMTLVAGVMVGLFIIVVFQGMYQGAVSWLQGYGSLGVAAPSLVFVAATLVAAFAFRRMSADQTKAKLTVAVDLANGLLAEGRALVLRDEREAAVAVYDDAATRLRDHQEEAVAELVAKALLAKGKTLVDLKREDNAIAAYDALVALMGDRAEQSIARQVAQGMLAKGVAHGRLQRPEKAIEAYDALIAKLGDRPEVSITEPVAKAMLAKGVALVQLKKTAAGMTALRELVRRVGSVSDESLVALVAKAQQLLKALDGSTPAQQAS